MRRGLMDKAVGLVHKYVPEIAGSSHRCAIFFIFIFFGPFFVFFIASSTAYQARNVVDLFKGIYFIVLINTIKVKLAAFCRQQNDFGGQKICDL